MAQARRGTEIRKRMELVMFQRNQGTVGMVCLARVVGRTVAGRSGASVNLVLGTVDGVSNKQGRVLWLLKLKNAYSLLSWDLDAVDRV